MAKRKCVTFLLPAKYVERKKMSSSWKNPANRLTGTEEIKSWLRETVKSHWFFVEDRRRYELSIAFHNPKEAALFKLAWL